MNKSENNYTKISKLHKRIKYQECRCVKLFFIYSWIRIIPVHIEDKDFIFINIFRVPYKSCINHIILSGSMLVISLNKHRIKFKIKSNM